MISVDFTSIDNAKIVSRLLPFWARGKKLNLFMQAILSPIVSIHDKFKPWALELYIQCHITAQKPSLEWYLNYKLSSHFAEADDAFIITAGEVDADTQAIINKMEIVESRKAGGTTTEGHINVYAPNIVSTMDYDTSDYERDIRYIMSKYITNFSAIDIYIVNAG